MKILIKVEMHTLRLHLFQCKIFSDESIFGKGKNFLVFGCILKIILENNFQCLVTFWKYYFPTKFSHFLNHFLSFQTNFISENHHHPHTNTHRKSTTSQNPPPHNTKTTKTPPPTPPQQQQKNQRSKRSSRSARK